MGKTGPGHRGLTGGCDNDNYHTVRRSLFYGVVARPSGIRCTKHLVLRYLQGNQYFLQSVLEFIVIVLPSREIGCQTS